MYCNNQRLTSLRYSVDCMLPFVPEYLRDQVRALKMVEENTHKSQLDVSERMKKLIASAESQKINSVVPLSRYYRSMLELHKMALSYLAEGQNEKALVLLVRFCSFVMEEIPKHTQYSQHQSEDKKRVNDLLKSSISLAEDVKTKVREYFEEDAARIARLLGHHKREQDHLDDVYDRQRLVPPGTTIEPGAAGQSVILQPINNSIAGSQIPSTSQTIFNPGYETSNISYSHLDPGPEPPTVISSTSSNVQKNTYTAASAGLRQMDGNRYKPVQSHTESVVDSSKFASFEHKSLVLPHDLVQKINQTLTASRHLFSPYVRPLTFFFKFMNTASDNTEKGVETCGILCGNIVKEKFIVSHVILPEQSGTGDGCTATGEDQVFTKQMELGVMTFGWIHTHPTQTAFLSSVDMHTQMAYQTLMKEAVAIVVAPKKNEVATFVLTPEGMNVIGSCQLTGFHPHETAIGRLYKAASHVHTSTSLGVVIVDIR